MDTSTPNPTPPAARPTPHIGYCYQPAGQKNVAGFRPRMTVICNAEGEITDAKMAADFKAGGWELIGHWAPGHAPLDAWDKAKA